MNSKNIELSLVNELDNSKAHDVVTINVSEITSEMMSMIIATGNSTRHVRSVSMAITEFAKNQDIKVIGIEGQNSGEWVLIDLGDTVVHVMLSETRKLYDLEKLWSQPKSAP